MVILSKDCGVDHVSDNHSTPGVVLGGVFVLIHICCVPQVPKFKSLSVLHAPVLQVLADAVANGAILIDVREDNEFETGHAAGARHMGRGIIERDIVQTFPDKGAELILYCGGGYRSALATDNLQKMGTQMSGQWPAARRRGKTREHPLNRI